MPTVQLVEEAEAQARVKEVFDEIRKSYGMIPNYYKTLAHNPELLEATWRRVIVVMGSGKLDPKTKQIIALAVSATNNCRYCIEGHTAVLKHMGLDDAAIVELMAVVELFNGLNKYADGLEIESDVKPEALSRPLARAADAS